MKRTKLICITLILIMLFSPFSNVFSANNTGENGDSSNHNYSKDCVLVLNDKSLEEFFNEEPQEFDGIGKLPFISGGSEIESSYDLRNVMNVNVKNQGTTRVMLGI